MLKIDQITVKYQDLTALSDVSLDIEEGKITALIGSNGAGKTTLLNAVSGLRPLSAGIISWENSLISSLSPDEVAALGVIQVPEGRKLFPRMTVEENLQIGAFLPNPRKQALQTMRKVFDLFPRLEERKKQHAGSLSGGEQQMVAIGRALMSLPKLLMLDEPSLGLAPIVTNEIFRIISELNMEGLTFLVVSQEALKTLSISSTAYLLENGRVLLYGPAAQIAGDSRVKESYLGI
ncbi:MAG: ABC transporter ATP-binding protein [Desulfomonilaceae bacterium]|jgi:branched-chain amino acid transport system ATP-binding protein